MINAFRVNAYLVSVIGILLVVIFSGFAILAWYVGLAALIIALNFALVAFIVWWVSCATIPIIMGDAPYVPSTRERVRTMLFAAKLTPQDRVVDLGSGDGRLVFHAIKAGAKEATGYEIHAGLVWKAKLEAHLRHMPNAHFVHASFWDISLREVDLVFVYQLPSAMVKLAEKFAEELPEGARIVSNAFTIPNWKPVAEHGKVRLYVKGISNPSS